MPKWWRHQMETFSALLAISAGNWPVLGEFPVQRPVTRSFDGFFDLCLNKWLSKQSWGWWFETPSCPLWCHNNEWVNVGFFESHRNPIGHTVPDNDLSYQKGHSWSPVVKGMGLLNQFPLFNNFLRLSKLSIYTLRLIYITFIWIMISTYKRGM